METLLATHMLKGQKLVDVGEVRITRTTLGKKQGERYLIYLPMNRNYLWRLLHDLDAKVRVFIEIPEDVLKKISQEGE
jgi:hypothetical protein